MLNFAAYYNQNGFYMKRLFLSVFALAFGAFAFISCNDDDKINKGGNDSERYLTVQEQQQAITTALDGVADAISFTDFSHALEFAEEMMGSDIELMDLVQALGSPAVLEDSLSRISWVKRLSCSPRIPLLLTFLLFTCRLTCSLPTRF